MFSIINPTQTYTPRQVSDLLQVSKNTVYELIDRGEIVAKKIGKLYRIPAASLSFYFTGLDYDLYLADQEDRKQILFVEKSIKSVRKTLDS